VWCDTTYSFTGGQWHEFDAVLAQVAAFGVKHVCVTGGEPLAQKACVPLLTALCDAGYAVSLETSGALDARGVDSRVHRVIDVKAPGSGEQERNFLPNLESLHVGDQVKFVIAGRDDYEWSRAFVAEHGLSAKTQVLFSPVQGQVQPRDLAEWILADRLAVRFQLQLHKLLWGDTPGK
jgi:7-carboxy-7-deazaguanine synthase